MSSNPANGPKLFNKKPKKAKLKSSSGQPFTMPSQSSQSRAPSAAPPPPPPPPQRPAAMSTPPLPPQKESFVRRYRFMWPLLLVVNFTLGAYVLLRTRQKDDNTSESDMSDTPSASTSSSLPSIASNMINGKTAVEPIPEPAQRPPIPVDQQRELFKWLLDEKRKIKPIDAEEKRRIDEEKALLKQFIRAKSMPSV